MPFTKDFIRRTLSQDIVEYLEEMIIEGKLKIGEKLPPELELSNNFGVSRNVVRESINTLATKGLVNKLGTKGTFIAVPNYEILENSIQRMLVLGNLSIDEMFEFRMTLELAIVEIAARKAKPEDLTKLSEIVEMMPLVSTDREKWFDHDLNFHIEVSKLSKNPLFIHLLKPLNIHLLYWIKLGYEVGGAVVSDHIEIFNAIKKNDPEAAKSLMKKHLMLAYTRVKEWSNKTVEKGTT